MNVFNQACKKFEFPHFAIQSKSTKRLSSGYKINSAADDAAGLSISEKMRQQIRGLDKASKNAQDGVSLIQVAEGSLNEVHSILQRMNELATQAANDTNTDSDREHIKDEIDDVTSFNALPAFCACRLCCITIRFPSFYYDIARKFSLSSAANSEPQSCY